MNPAVKRIATAAAIYYGANLAVNTTRSVQAKRRQKKLDKKYATQQF